jgi:iron complex transport system permease protein
MLMGASFLLFVDDLARNITTGELPLGILTSFVGAPLFIYLIVTGGGKKNA